MWSDDEFLQVQEERGQMPIKQNGSFQFDYTLVSLGKHNATAKVEDVYAVQRKMPNAVERWLANNEATTTALDQEDDHEMDFANDVLSVNIMPSVCCLTALDAVGNNHLSCLSGMAECRDDTRASELCFHATDPNGETALHLAVRKGDDDMVKLLLSFAPTLCECQSRSGDTPALLAAGLGRQNTLVHLLSAEEGSRSATMKDHNGTSVLMAAVVRNDNEMANYLLERFGQELLLLPNRTLMLPAHVAAAKGNIDFLKAAAKVDASVINCRDAFGCTPAVYAVQGGWLSVLRWLIEQSKEVLLATNNKGMSLLHVACIEGDENIARYLLGKMGRSAVSARTLDDANAVHCAAYSGHAHILAVLLSGLAKKKRKEVLAARDSHGNTPLHLAVIGGYIECALFLVEAGSDPSQFNSLHQTAREVALIRGHGSLAGALAGATAGKTRFSLAFLTPFHSFITSQTAHRKGSSSATPNHRLPLQLYSDLLDDVRVEPHSPSYYFRQSERPKSYAPLRVKIADKPLEYSSTDTNSHSLPSGLLMVKPSPKSSTNSFSSGYSSAAGERQKFDEGKGLITFTGDDADRNVKGSWLTGKYKDGLEITSLRDEFNIGPGTLTGSMKGGTNTRPTAIIL